MIYRESRDSIIIHGGTTFGLFVFSDLWEYSFATNSWSEILSSSEPVPLSRASILYRNDSNEEAFYLFGGDNGEYSNTLYKFLLEDRIWKTIEIEEGSGVAIPSGRSYSGLVPFFRNNDEGNGIQGFGIISGCVGRDALRDAYYYDFGTLDFIIRFYLFVLLLPFIWLKPFSSSTDSNTWSVWPGSPSFSKCGHSVSLLYPPNNSGPRNDGTFLLYGGPEHLERLGGEVNDLFVVNVDSTLPPSPPPSASPSRSSGKGRYTISTTKQTNKQYGPRSSVFLIPIHFIL